MARLAKLNRLDEFLRQPVRCGVRLDATMRQMGMRGAGMKTHHPRTQAAEQTKRQAFNEDVRVSLAVGISTEQVGQIRPAHQRPAARSVDKGPGGMSKCNNQASRGRGGGAE